MLKYSEYAFIKYSLELISYQYALKHTHQYCQYIVGKTINQTTCILYYKAYGRYFKCPLP